MATPACCGGEVAEGIDVGAGVSGAVGTDEVGLEAVADGGELDLGGGVRHDHVGRGPAGCGHAAAVSTSRRRCPSIVAAAAAAGRRRCSGCHPLVGGGFWLPPPVGGGLWFPVFVLVSTIIWIVQRRRLLLPTTYLSEQKPPERGRLSASVPE